MDTANPPSYSLRPGEIHVWKAPLASVHSALAHLRPILSPAERERALRFSFEKDAARFISCRASLRLILSRYIAVPPEGILFRYDPGGKPALSGVPGWQFNVSHSRDLAAIAISRYDPLGIDLELIDPDFPRDEVAPDILAPDELSDLAALPPADQPAWFFQLWTLKEALLKALGTGFSLDPRSIRIRLDQAQNPAIISAPPDFLRATLHRFPLHPGYAAALAVLAPVSTLSFFTL
jgi:4'-phosphopantetheinyl transferase